jgi:suppressor of ftsI
MERMDKRKSPTTASRRVLPLLSFAAGLIFLTGSVRSEWHYDEISWSSSVCTDHGIDDGLFDFCAILEFCEGDGVSLTTSSMNYAPITYDYSSSLPSTMEQEQQQQQIAVTSSSGRGAKYGWRMDGSTSCSSPGPILRLDNKNRYALLVKGGASSTTTNLHTHGLHIAGSGNADDVTRTLAPGDTLVYNVTLPKDHVGGTYWYHSHYHPHTKDQVTGGAFGMLIVDDDEGNIGTTDPRVLQFLKKERILILDNIQGGNRFVANGQPSGEIYEFQKDEWYRLRILLVSVDDYLSGATVFFGEEGECTVYPIAHDGIPTFRIPSTAQPKSSYYLSTSSRLDVAIQCHASANIKVQFSTVATIKVSSNNTTSSEAAATATPFEKGQNHWTSSRPPYLADLRELPVDDTLAITMSETAINQMPFSLETPLCNPNGQDFKYNSVVEWTLLSTTSHPFHSHMYPMQVVSGCGEEHDVGEYYDTVSFRNKMNSYYGSDTSNCVVRVRLLDIAGHVLVHCHILLHSEQGSMAFFNVLNGPTQPSELRALSCGNEKGNKDCDPIVQPKHCSGPQYPMSHSADMMGNVEGEMNMNMNNGNNDMMDSVSGNMKQHTIDGEQNASDPEVLTNNGEQQLNSNSQAVQETNNPSFPNNTMAGQLNYTPTDYSVTESYSPMEDTSTSPTNASTEMTVSENMDQMKMSADTMDANITITSTLAPTVSNPKPTTSPTAKVAEEEVPSGDEPDTSSYPGSTNEDVEEKRFYGDELVTNGTNISSEGGALESELSLIGTLNESSDHKHEIEGSSVPELQPTVEPLHVTNEEYTISQESAYGSREPDSVVNLTTTSSLLTGSMPVDNSFPIDSKSSDASSHNKNANTTTSISEASMNSERFAIIMFAILASSTIACILIFYGVRNRKKKTSDYVSRNEEEEIGLNTVV